MTILREEVCNCGCHKTNNQGRPRMRHTIPCCKKCKKCGAKIKWTHTKAHEKGCMPRWG